MEKTKLIVIERHIETQKLKVNRKSKSYRNLEEKHLEWNLLKDKVRFFFGLGLIPVGIIFGIFIFFSTLPILVKVSIGIAAVLTPIKAFRKHVLDVNPHKVLDSNAQNQLGK